MFHDTSDRFGGSPRSARCLLAPSLPFSGETFERSYLESRAWVFSSHGAGDDRASDISCRGILLRRMIRSRLRVSFSALGHLAMSPSAFLREKVAKIGVTIGS